MLSKTLTLAVLLAATVVSATLTSASSNTIVDLAVATPDLSTLVTALKAADLVDTLSGKGPFTVFAPTNEAFAKLPAGVLANLLKPENKAQLAALLTYHVLPGSVPTQTLPKGQQLDPSKCTTVEGEKIEVYNACTNRKCTRSEVKINPIPDIGTYQALVARGSGDIVASNGLVSLISGVLTLPTGPRPFAKNIVSLIEDGCGYPGAMNTLPAALKAAGLVDTLSGKGPFTVFAPTDSAFAKLPAGVLANLLKPENKAQLVDILTYHVLPGDVTYQALENKDGQMIKTVEGKSVTVRVSGDIFINDAKFKYGYAPDVNASNGGK